MDGLCRVAGLAGIRSAHAGEGSKPPKIVYGK
jgi:hypothetical protein